MENIRLSSIYDVEILEICIIGLETVLDVK